MKTTEQREIARCESEMRENDGAPEDQLMRLLGWADWTIEQEFLTQHGGFKEMNDKISYVTKDSGERMQFTSGMQRDTTTGKTRFDLAFDGPMFERWADLLTRGAQKYTARNWMKATGQEELERFKESAVRHFYQWLRGDTDEDHGAAVFFNINGAEYVKGLNPERNVCDHGVSLFVDCEKCSAL